MSSRHGSNVAHDDGFTLLELLISVSILGLLIAIAMPMFLSARDRAEDSQATSSVRATFDTIQAVIADPNVQGDPVDLLEEAEPTYEYTWDASTAPHVVSVGFVMAPVAVRTTLRVDVGGGDVHAQVAEQYTWAVVLAAKSKSGRCVVGVYHSRGGTGMEKLEASDTPRCQGSLVPPTLFPQVFVSGGDPSGGAAAISCNPIKGECDSGSGAGTGTDPGSGGTGSGATGPGEAGSGEADDDWTDETDYAKGKERWYASALARCGSDQASDPDCWQREYAAFDRWAEGLQSGEDADRRAWRGTSDYEASKRAWLASTEKFCGPRTAAGADCWARQEDKFASHWERRADAPGEPTQGKGKTK